MVGTTTTWWGRQLHGGDDNYMVETLGRNKIWITGNGAHKTHPMPE